MTYDAKHVARSSAYAGKEVHPAPLKHRTYAAKQSHCSAKFEPAAVVHVVLCQQQPGVSRGHSSRHARRQSRTNTAQRPSNSASQASASSVPSVQSPSS